MKILTFTTLFPNKKRPDFGIFVYQRISHLVRSNDAAVKVVAPVPYFPSWLRSRRWDVYRDIPHNESLGTLEVYHPRYPLVPGLFMPLHGILMFLGSWLLAYRLHKKFRFDCIDAHYVYPDGFTATLLGKLLGIPVVISARGSDVNVFPSFRAVRPLISWSLRRAVGVIAVAAALKNSMIGLGVSERAIRVIPNGVDLDKFYPHDRTAARTSLNIPTDEKVVVSVGSLTESKNHSLLISAFAKLLNSHPDSKLYIVGEGSLRATLENLVRAHQLEQKITLAGQRPNDQLSLWFSAADVSCLTSRREGWPNVLMESLACGTPVVATRVGGVPEILSSPELGTLVEQNSQSVAEGLKQALEKKWDRGALVQHAQKRSWNDVAEEVASFLKDCISGSNQSTL
jgi:teichuronic acid biosynthesis glycosyltransferase TuaC